MLLALEATDRSGSLALIEDGEMHRMSFERSQVTHSERLMPEVDRLLTEHSAEYSDIESIAVSRGPGSFTAIRLAVTTAKTLALSLDAEVVAPTTLRVMAEYATVRNRLIITALDARRGELYTQDFRRRNSDVMTESDARLMSPEELKEHCHSIDRPVMVFRGRDIELDVSTWSDDLDVVPENLIDPLAGGLMQVATGPDRDKFVQHPDEVKPCYVRKSDAQRSRAEEGQSS